MGYGVLAQFKTTVNHIIGNLIKCLSITLSEAATHSGTRFSHEFDITLANGETRYFLYKVPSDGKVIGLQSRRFKSFGGAVDLKVLWNSTGVVEGTLEKIYNENNKYDFPTVAEGLETFRISQIAAPTTEGVVRESDFLTSTGSGNNSAGSISDGAGYRLYNPDTFYIAKVTNLDNASNRVILGYSWIEENE